jgi:hypothetical protein
LDLGTSSNAPNAPAAAAIISSVAPALLSSTTAGGKVERTIMHQQRSSAFSGGTPVIAFPSSEFCVPSKKAWRAVPLLKPGQGGDPVLVWQRIRLDLTRHARNSLAGTQLGRYGIIGELSDVEVAAGYKIAEIHACYDAAMGVRRHIASPSYEAGFGRDAGHESQAEAVRSKSAQRAYEAMMAVLTTANRTLGRGLIEAVEDVCVEDLVCPPGRFADLRTALAMVAAHFGYRAPHAPRAKNPNNCHNSQNPVRSPPPSDKEKFHRALIDREKYRADKVRRGTLFQRQFMG